MPPYCPNCGRLLHHRHLHLCARCNRDELTCWNINTNETKANPAVGSREATTGEIEEPDEQARGRLASEEGPQWLLNGFYKFIQFCQWILIGLAVLYSCELLGSLAKLWSVR